MKIKKPILTWLVGLWVFIQYKTYVIYPLDRYARVNEIPRESMVQWRGLGIWIAIFLGIALIRMQNKARYVAIACLGFGWFMLARLAFILLANGKLPPLVMGIYMLLSLTLNPLSIWYLVRPSYGRRCDQFRKAKATAKNNKSNICTDDLEPMEETN